MTEAITEQTITAEEIAYWEFMIAAVNMKDSVENLTARLKSRRAELGLGDTEFSKLSQIPPSASTSLRMVMVTFYYPICGGTRSRLE